MAQKRSKNARKILILGSSGMLAADLIKVFREKEKYKITAWDRDDLDITNEEAVNKKISKLKPDIIINAAAYTAVDKCETEFDKALLINGYALRFLSESALKIGAILVHYSTDYVFNGENSKGYKEDDEPNPVSSYGQSKFVGEQMILLAEANNYGGCGGCALSRGKCAKAASKIKPFKYYLIRTSWLYGHNGKNFVDTMISLGQSRGLGTELKVVNDQFGKPTYTLDLAKKTREIIEKNLPFGAYHFTNETGKKGISWYDFAREFFKIKKIKVKVKPVTTKEFYGADKTRLAKRPKYSMLVNTKLPRARDWKKALKDYLLS
ncbi:NAD(P)-dependent oxidoreductase [Patescibacteria group bacterium]|nr:NAD(P)-dependent oxidoreductase [Patescibacteria group bacterium]MBU3999756.1 NAD(P)-dependent oxidoreductase [Patescibacteria group bacterium]MBU4056499.1 NAD(P)-dependent oxidoreductase [Patescibacteria group bacterium]MBU4368436.1 NAD(P)-dependent oxidoreductase [Patescibacteria group bacterium]